MAATAITGQAPINLGPLTTTFTPPPACATAVLSLGPFENINLPIFNPQSAFLGQSCDDKKGIDATSCWPPISSGAAVKEAPLQGWGFYSPGVHCPAGYASGCSAVGGATSSADWDMQFKLGAKETAVGCCPSGYQCANVGGQTCMSVASATTSINFATCDRSNFVMRSMDLKKDPFTFFAPMIQINWQSSDNEDKQTTATKTEDAAPRITTLTPAVPPEETGSANPDGPLQPVDPSPAPTGTEPFLPPAPAPTETDQSGTTPDQQTQTQEDQDQNGPQQLSSSTKIGIGVAGGAVAAVAIILIIFYLWRRRNSRHEDAELDRLYGMKHANTGSSSDLTAHHAQSMGNDEIPGWYRGARPFSPLTPTARVVSPAGGLSANGYQGVGGGAGLEFFYASVSFTHPIAQLIRYVTIINAMSTESPTRPLLLPQNRKLRHLRGIYLRNLTFTRPRGRTIDDASLNKSAAKLETLRETAQLHHAASSEDLRPSAGRRRSTNPLNANPLTRQKRIEDTFDTSLADSFFSIHVDGEEQPVYISEVAGRSANFNFRPFDLSALERSVTRSAQITIKVWARPRDAWSLLLVDDVDLRALNWLGDIQNVHFPPNSLIFHMIDGIYSIDLSGKPPQPPKKIAPLPTSSYNVLMRLATLDNSIQDAIATRDHIAAQINSLLETEPKNELPEAEDKRLLATKYLSQQQRLVAAAKKKNDTLRASIAARRAAIEEGRALQARAERDVENATLQLSQSKELAAKTREQIHGQRRRICEDLARIYSINPVPLGPPLSFQICGIPLPNTVYDSTSKSSSEDVLSAALGHVAQLTNSLQYYLSVPLPYPIKPFGSRSSICDHISQLADPQREFPLYLPRGGSSAQFRFDYGWFLLNKDIEVLCASQGLKVVDIRHTLPNLKYLLYVCSAGTEEVPERKRGGVRGLWAGRMKTLGIPGSGAEQGDGASSVGGSRRGSDASEVLGRQREELQRALVAGRNTGDVGNGNGNGNGSPTSSSLLPFDEGITGKLTLRTKGLRENVAR
ncbi:UV radiation resistance protein and autophagy-related subunit 14 domain containing protein [Naviculisporaceae sp. PSN 640]